MDQKLTLIPRVTKPEDNSAGMTCMMSVCVRRYQGVLWGFWRLVVERQ